MMDVPGHGFHVGLRRRIPKRRRPDDSEGVPGYGIYGSRNIFDTISPILTVCMYSSLAWAYMKFVAAAAAGTLFGQQDQFQRLPNSSS
jgi:hypothetical protein